MAGAANIKRIGPVRVKVLHGVILGTLLFTMSASAHQPESTVTPSLVQFGPQTIGTTSKPATITLTNNSRVPLGVTSVELSPARFSYSGASLPVTLRPGQSLTGVVTFSPTAARNYNGQLTFRFSTGQENSIELWGTGVTQPTVPAPVPGSTPIPATAAPAISSNPASTTVTAGHPVTFSVAATGTAPLSYQWSMNGTTMSGATSSSYSIAAATMANNGAQFAVSVSNPAGSVTSNAATLTVNTATVAPSITTQPASQTVTAGQTATFSVAATGTAPMSYQWNMNGAAISGANSASYALATTAANSGEKFSVTVSNAVGNITSSSATLTVNAATVAPSITTQPASQTVTAGQTATFSVAATGTAPMSYQWNMNGAAISGANSASYALATTAANSGEQFSVTVSNAAGNITSSSATLTVNSVTTLLSANPTNLSFGNVTVNASNTQSATLTNNSSTTTVNITNVSISGAGFSPSGISTGQMIAPGKSATVTVTFAPSGTGAVSGSVTISSDASNSPTAIALTGTGTSAPTVSHSVSLQWTASTSTVIGYNVYRGTVTGGPYTELNTSTGSVTTTSFMDTTVQAGTTYYYVVAAVGPDNVESVYSNQTTATIP